MTELYSIKELQLIHLLHFDHMVGHIGPIQLYEMMAKRVFIENLSGSEVESLRRCVKAIHYGTIYRHTQEWDELIKL